MATTKSTVVGIRLDHERRAWVEAEAARLGVSVRGLFEGMIDEARSGETEPAVARSEDSARDRVREFRPSVDEVCGAGPTRAGPQPSEQQESARPGDASTPRPTSPGSSVPGVGIGCRDPLQHPPRRPLAYRQRDRVERAPRNEPAQQLRVNATLGRSLAVNTNATAAIAPRYRRAVVTW